jgi:putative addiction module component (TIGR02574 family)
MTIDQIASEALRFPPRDRALLAGLLWESLEDPSATTTQMDEASIVALATERDQEIEAGKVEAVSHEEMMARLRR